MIIFASETLFVLPFQSPKPSSGPIADFLLVLLQNRLSLLSPPQIPLGDVTKIDHFKLVPSCQSNQRSNQKFCLIIQFLHVIQNHRYLSVIVSIMPEGDYDCISVKNEFMTPLGYMMDRRLKPRGDCIN